MTETDFRLPDIKGSDTEQLRRIRSYLYQLVPQLELALNPQSGNGTAASAASDVAEQRESTRTHNLGLSQGILTPADGKAYCRYHADGAFSAVMFCIALPPSELPTPDLPIPISAKPLPKACRPSAPVYAVCHAEFLCADGETVCGTVSVRVTENGFPELVCVCAGRDDVVTVGKVQGTVCFA